MSINNNSYYPILLHALNKAEGPINPEIEKYKKCLIENSEKNYRTVSAKGTFPYCLCSLSHSQIERTIEIEYVSVSARSMRIGLITSPENIFKRKRNQNSNHNEKKIYNNRKSVLNREILMLRCRCMPYKSVDWCHPVHIKLIGLLSDYKYKIDGSLRVLNEIFRKEETEDEALIETDAIRYIEKAVHNEDIKKLIGATHVTSEQNKLISKIIRNTRTEK